MKTLKKKKWRRRKKEKEKKKKKKVKKKKKKKEIETIHGVCVKVDGIRIIVNNKKI